MLERCGRYSVFCVATLALVLVLVGCGGESSQAVLDLVPLQMQMVEEYGGSNVVVELQDEGTLSFLVVEDASEISASDLGVERAREIADFVCGHYGSMNRIDTVEVAFEFRGDGSVVDSTGRVAYAFARTELVCSER